MLPRANIERTLQVTHYDNGILHHCIQHLMDIMQANGHLGTSTQTALYGEVLQHLNPSSDSIFNASEAEHCELSVIISMFTLFSIDSN